MIPITKHEITTRYNYERAINAIRELEEHAKRCSLETSQLSGISVKFIEGAFYKEEIGEQDHNTLLDRVATANNKFLHDCGCRSLSLINIK